VQRYLTGKSIGQSRLGLLLNAMAKVPMQFFILFIGAMVFVVFLFERPPLVFHPVAMARVEASPQFADLESRYEKAFEERATAARRVKDEGIAAAPAFQAAQKQVDATRAEALKVAGESDTNYIFLSFVIHYLPVGVVGLIVAVIFTAAMSAISGEINSLATVTIIDVYRRYWVKEADDRHYLRASRAATVFWGLYAVGFASFASGFGALIEAVNQVGSLFYGGMLGVFVLAFFVPRVGANAAFAGVLAGEAAIFAAAKFTDVAFLWYNVIGCVVVVVTASLISLVRKEA
jgi:Na+(H+)/acetate symporter ActP